MNPKTLCTKHYARLVREIWYAENARCFNGRLERCPSIKQFDIADFSAEHTRGVSPYINRLAIVREYFDTVKELRETIIHEMIHQAQGQSTSKYIRERELHGRFFRRNAARIQKIVGFDPVHMYPKKGTPGFFISRPAWDKDRNLSNPGVQFKSKYKHFKRGENCPHCKG